MNVLDDGFGGYLVLLLVAVLAHEPWRWLGFLVGARLDPEGEFFQWVKAVSTALVAGLVGRLLFFPSGALASVPSAVRITAFSVAVAIYVFSGRSLWWAIVAGSTTLVAGTLLSPA